MLSSTENTEPVGATTALTSRLEQAIIVVGHASGEDSNLTKRLRHLLARLENSRLQVAILGQFKRGKSTFVNALLGVAILPTGVVPLTAVPTFISWSENPQVRVSFSNGKARETLESEDVPAMEEFLSRFVTEERNPKNALAVERVDLLYPAPLLRDGTVFIDTPGIGSTFMHNTEAALRVIPECDVSLFVVSADPPITQVEFDYLRALRGKIGRIIFVMNKVDYLGIAEKRKAIYFLRSVLAIESLFESEAEIFAVSARSGLAAKQANDQKVMEHSGIGAVEARLEQFAAFEKMDALRAAIARKAVDIVALAESEVLLRIEAPRIPLATLEQKAAEFALSAKAIEAKRLAVADMLSGERRRIISDLEMQVTDLRERILSRTTQKVDETISSHQDWPAELRSVLPNHLENMFLQARQQFVSSFARKAETIVADYQQQIEALIADVRRTAAGLFSVAFARQEEAESFQLQQEPYWVTECVETGLLPDLSPFIDRFLPERARNRRRRQRIVNQTTELIIRNAENLRWAILRGLDETFRAAAASSDEMLRDALRTTKEVIDEAVGRRTQGSFKSAPVLQSLHRYKDELMEVRSSLTQ